MVHVHAQLQGDLAGLRTGLDRRRDHVNLASRKCIYQHVGTCITANEGQRASVQIHSDVIESVQSCSLISLGHTDKPRLATSTWPVLCHSSEASNAAARSRSGQHHYTALGQHLNSALCLRTSLLLVQIASKAATCK